MGKPLRSLPRISVCVFLLISFIRNTRFTLLRLASPVSGCVILSDTKYTVTSYSSMNQLRIQCHSLTYQALSAISAVTVVVSMPSTMHIFIRKRVCPLETTIPWCGTHQPSVTLSFCRPVDTQNYLIIQLCYFRPSWSFFMSIAMVVYKVS